MKRFATLAFCVLCCVCSGTSVHAQTFQDFLNRIFTTPDSQRTAMVDSFMTAVPAFPFVEGDTVCHFIYRGTGNNVTVPGDANEWDVNGFPMNRIPPTDFWYLTKIFEPDARLDYKFVLNGSTWILDPRNPHQVLGGFGPNSELRMPGYVPAPEIEYYPSILHGTLRDTTYYSINLGNSRTIRVYTPPGYETSSDSFPVVLFHDGLEYVTLAQANNVIDYLIAEDLIDPVIGVFVPPVNRTAEYAGNQQNQFTAFIVNEIMPYLDSRYRTQRNPSRRATLGASNGGNISLWLGYTHHEVFGNIAAHSSYIQPSLVSGFQNSPRLDLRLYMDLGTYDIGLLIPLVRGFVPILQSKGYDYRYIEYHEGHSWGNWRAHIDNALRMFFPSSTVDVPEKKGKLEGYRLYQNYPNPFNPRTRFTFQVSRFAFVSLTVYDVLGREVASLVSEEKEPGSYEVGWDGTGFASGIYFYTLMSGGYIDTKKLLLLH